MRKESSFGEHWGDGWPELKEIQASLLESAQREAFFAKGRDGGCLTARGLYGTEDLPVREGLVTAILFFHLHPDYGTTLLYTRWDGRVQKKDSFSSKGDLRLLGKFVRSFHGTPLSLALFIPFEHGWKAIKEFMETEGEFPKSIEWISDADLPPETFPDP